MNEFEGRARRARRGITPVSIHTPSEIDVPKQTSVLQYLQKVIWKVTSRMSDIPKGPKKWDQTIKQSDNLISLSFLLSPVSILLPNTAVYISA